jgi:hypothetical protein
VSREGERERGIGIGIGIENGRKGEREREREREREERTEKHRRADRSPKLTDDPLNMVNETGIAWGKEPVRVELIKLGCRCSAA